MKRRNAIQNIALITGGSILFQSCKFSDEYIVGDKVLNDDQLNLIKEVSEYILPIENLKVESPESLTEFIITMLNDCYSPKDINKYITGLDEFSESIKVYNNYNSLVFDDLESLESKSENYIFFINTTKHLSITHLLHQNSI